MNYLLSMNAGAKGGWGRSSTKESNIITHIRHRHLYITYIQL